MKNQCQPNIFFGINNVEEFKQSLSWQEYSLGGRSHAKIVEIYNDVKSGQKSAFVLFEPGSNAKSHTHQGYENILILSGGFNDEFGEYVAGSLVVYEPGSQHQWCSKDGAFMYVTWTGPTVINNKE